MRSFDPKCEQKWQGLLGFASRALAISIGLAGLITNETFANEQIITSMPGQFFGVTSTSNITVEVRYHTMPADGTLSGLGLRVHFDSRRLNFASASEVFPRNLVLAGTSSQPDSQDLDRDMATDRFVLLSWASVQNLDWPNTDQQIRLFRITFTPTTTFTTSVLRYTGETANGFRLVAPPVHLSPFLATQEVSPPAPQIAASINQPVDVAVRYGTRDPVDTTLEGIGLRIYFDSGRLNFGGLSNVLPRDLVGFGSPVVDSTNADGDDTTDRYVMIAWADQDLAWPNAAAPTLLFTARFTPLTEQVSTVRFTATDIAAGRAFIGSPLSIGGPLTTLLDLDDNGVCDALTDGLLLLRHLFGFTATTLIDGAVGDGAQRATAPAISAHVSNNLTRFDVDRSGNVDALTDGLLVLRYFFGFRGVNLTDGAVAGNTSAPEIEVSIADLCP